MCRKAVRLSADRRGLVTCDEVVPVICKVCSDHGFHEGGQCENKTAYLRLKAHVEHAVGFIQHHKRRPAQRAGFHLDQIDHASRRAYCHLS